MIEIKAETPDEDDRADREDQDQDNCQINGHVNGQHIGQENGLDNGQDNGDDLNNNERPESVQNGGRADAGAGDWRIPSPFRPIPHFGSLRVKLSKGSARLPGWLSGSGATALPPSMLKRREDI